MARIIDPGWSFPGSQETANINLDHETQTNNAVDSIRSVNKVMGGGVSKTFNLHSLPRLDGKVVIVTGGRSIDNSVINCTETRSIHTVAAWAKLLFDNLQDLVPRSSPISIA
jgi:hypothetical protein